MSTRSRSDDTENIRSRTGRLPQSRSQIPTHTHSHTCRLPPDDTVLCSCVSSTDGTVNPPRLTFCVVKRRGGMDVGGIQLLLPSRPFLPASTSCPPPFPPPNPTNSVRPHQPRAPTCRVTPPLRILCDLRTCRCRSRLGACCQCQPLGCYFCCYPPPPPPLCYAWVGSPHLMQEPAATSATNRPLLPPSGIGSTPHSTGQSFWLAPRAGTTPAVRSSFTTRLCALSGSFSLPVSMMSSPACGLPAAPGTACP